MLPESHNLTEWIVGRASIFFPTTKKKKILVVFLVSENYLRCMSGWANSIFTPTEKREVRRKSKESIKELPVL